MLDKLSAAGIPSGSASPATICHWKLTIFSGRGVVSGRAPISVRRHSCRVTPYQNYEDEVICFPEQLVPSFTAAMFDNIWTNTRSAPTTPTCRKRLCGTTRRRPSIRGSIFRRPTATRIAWCRSSTASPSGGWIDVDIYRITTARPVDALIRAASRGVRIRMYLEPNEYQYGEALGTRCRWIASWPPLSVPGHDRNPHAEASQFESSEDNLVATQLGRHLPEPRTGPTPRTTISSRRTSSPTRCRAIC